MSVEHGPERSVNSVTRRLADTSDASRRLGFKAEISLQEGLNDLVQWWRAEQVADKASRGRWTAVAVGILGGVAGGGPA